MKSEQNNLNQKKTSLLLVLLLAVLGLLLLGLGSYVVYGKFIINNNSESKNSKEKTKKAEDDEGQSDYPVYYKAYLDYSLGSKWRVISKETLEMKQCANDINTADINTALPCENDDCCLNAEMIKYTQWTIEYEDINNEKQNLVINNSSALINGWMGSSKFDTDFSYQILDFAQAEIIKQLLAVINAEDEFIVGSDPTTDHAYLYFAHFSLGSEDSKRFYDNIINKNTGLKLQNLSLESFFPSKIWYFSVNINANDVADYNKIIETTINKIKGKTKMPIDIYFKVAGAENIGKMYQDRAFIKNEEFFINATCDSNSCFQYNNNLYQEFATEVVWSNRTIINN